MDYIYDIYLWTIIMYRLHVCSICLDYMGALYDIIWTIPNYVDDETKHRLCVPIYFTNTSLVSRIYHTVVNMEAYLECDVISYVGIPLFR